MDYHRIEQVVSTAGSLSPNALFFVLSVLLTSAFALYFYKYQRDGKKRTNLEAAARLNSTARLVDLQQREMLHLQERLKMLESYVDRLNRRQQFIVENNSQRQQRVDEAIHIAARGLEDDELVSRAGVSASEAKLITNLYSRGSAG